MQFLGRNPGFKSSTVLHEKLAKNAVLNQLQISKKCLNAKGEEARSAEDLKKNSFSCFIYKIRENFRTFRFFLESLDKKGRQWQFYKAGFFL